MLIQVPTSMTIASATPGLVSLSTLANDVHFHVNFIHRQTADVLVALVDDAKQGQVSAWLSSQTSAVEVSTEVDTAEWLFQRKAPVPRPVLPTLTPSNHAAAQPAPASLSTQKYTKRVAVDTKTDALISAGFIVDGKTFSASDAAQLKWLGMYTSKADLSYPVTVPTKDDTQFVSLIDATDVATYYAALLARIQTVLAGGVTLKALIAGAGDQAALDAIVDNRT